MNYGKVQKIFKNSKLIHFFLNLLGIFFYLIWEKLLK